MAISPFAMMILAFLFSFSAVAAVSLVVRNLLSQRVTNTGSHLDMKATVQRKRRRELRQLQASGGIDRWFARLIEISATRADINMAICLVLVSAFTGAATVLVLTDSVLFGILALPLGATIPIVWWSAQRGIRIHKMSKQIPEALELIADNIRSGRNLQQATQMASIQLPAPLKDEFQRCAGELQLGNNPVDSLTRMAERLELPELRVFATAALVHQKSGGDLALLAERLSTSAYDRQQVAEHLTSVTAGSRLSAIGMVAGSLLGLGALHFINPNYQQTLLAHPLGPTLIGTAGVLFIIGTLWSWRILRIRY